MLPHSTSTASRSVRVYSSSFKAKVDDDYQITDLFDSLCYSFLSASVGQKDMRIIHISLLLLYFFAFWFFYWFFVFFSLVVSFCLISVCRISFAYRHFIDVVDQPASLPRRVCVCASVYDAEKRNEKRF